MAWCGGDSLAEKGGISLFSFFPFFSLLLHFCLISWRFGGDKERKERENMKKSRYKGMMKDRQEKHLALILSKGKGKRERS